jgi:hypothetical protein
MGKPRCAAFCGFPSVSGDETAWSRQGGYRTFFFGFYRQFTTSAGWPGLDNKPAKTALSA